MKTAAVFIAQGVFEVLVNLSIFNWIFSLFYWIFGFFFRLLMCRGIVGRRLVWRRMWFFAVFWVLLVLGWVGCRCIWKCIGFASLLLECGDFLIALLLVSVNRFAAHTILTGKYFLLFFCLFWFFLLIRLEIFGVFRLFHALSYSIMQLVIIGLIDYEIILVGIFGGLSVVCILSSMVLKKPDFKKLNEKNEE